LPYEFCPGQITDIHTFVNPMIKEAGFIRARGGSKTKDLGVIANLYMAFMGLHAVTYVAEADMLAQPKHYYWSFVNNSFLKYALTDPPLKESCTFRSGGIYELLNLTEGKARSRRIDCVYYDEESDADQDAFNASEGTLSVSRYGLVRHGSTPKKGTVFERNIRRLYQVGAPVSVRGWQELPHISLDHIRRVKIKYPGWYFRQEYDGTFEAAQGRVFENVINGPFDLSHLSNLYDRTVEHYGLDWNPRAGHYLVGSRWNDDQTANYLLLERNLGTDLGTVLDVLFDLLLSHPKSLIEIEDGGTNAGYCDALFMEIDTRNKTDPRYRDISRRIFRRPWDSAGKNKQKSITTLMTSTLYAHEERTPETFYWLETAHWDENSTDPKLEKDPDQHALDAYLHSAWVGKWGV